MKYKEITLDGIDYLQINKRRAKRMYDDGYAIYLLPCNANPRSVWNTLHEIRQDKEVARFDSVVRSYEYYNCTGEMGRYAVFFIKKRR